jgi:ABC-2 type transport system permease protein
MNKVWAIARYEYLRHVRRRAFLLAGLGLPLLMGAVIGIVVLVVVFVGAERGLGIVDPAGRWASVSLRQLDTARLIPTPRYRDETAARRALDAGSIDAYIVLPDDFLQSGEVDVVARRRLSERAQEQIQGMVREYVLLDVAPENRERLREPDELLLRTVDGGRTISADNLLLFFLPYGFALVFLITTFTTSGYLLQAVAEEKEDRVGEIMAVTVAPRQMMAGKILGLSGVGLTQMLLWGAIALAGVMLLATDGRWLAEVRLPWPVVSLAILYFVLGYLLIAGCYATIGAMVPSPQEAQPLVAPVSMLSLAPLFVVSLILAKPNGTLAVIFSLIPLSSPMTMLMRLPLADIPSWQIVVSLLLLAGSAVGVMLLSGRVLRLGMLRYGKRLTLGEITRAEA